MPEKLKDPPSVPTQFLHIWGWFEDLTSARINNVGMSFSFSPIRYSEMKAYFDLMWLDPNPEEVKVLKLFDGIFLHVMNEDSNG